MIRMKFVVRQAADPYKSDFECAGGPFDFIEETMTKDWAGVRTELDRFGITPTASYTMPTHGESKRRKIKRVHLYRNPPGLDSLGL